MVTQIPEPPYWRLGSGHVCHSTHVVMEGTVPSLPTPSVLHQVHVAVAGPCPLPKAADPIS